MLFVGSLWSMLVGVAAGALVVGGASAEEGALAATATAEDTASECLTVPMGLMSCR